MKASNADNKPGRIADLPPDQLALLMLKLREKASSRADKEPRLADIRPVPRDGNIPLSFAQQRLWFIDQLQPGSPAYNTPIAMRMAGPLDAALLQRSLSALMRRHEILRTSFPTVAGQPVQAIAPAQLPPLPLIDLRALPAPEREDAARRLAEDAAQQPFDLAHGPLLRAAVLRLDAAAHVVLLTTHHIICDGWSTPILMRELNLLYDGFATGKPAALPELPVQYADYAVWQRAWLQGAVLEEQLAYWKAQLAGLPTLELPTDYPRPAVETFRGALQGFALPVEVSAGLTTLSRQAGTTMFMTVLAAWKLLLARYSGQDDIVVGTPIANRRRAETEGLIGFFINTLVLRADLSGNPAFSEALGRVRKSCLGAYAHQDLPFEQVVEALQPARDLSRHPLFQVMFALHNETAAPAGQAGMGMRPLEIERGTTHFDLSMSVEETGAGLVGSLEYRTDLFAPSMIARMLEHFQTLLEGIVARPALPIAALPLLTDAERQQLLVAWNATQAAYPHDQCLHQLFEAQATRTPDAVAMVFARGQGSGVRGQGDKETSRQADKETEDRRSKIHDLPSSILHPQSLTYRELNARANRLAHHLRSLGVGPEVRVGICLERSLDLLVGLLGVLKAGGAYVPLDPAYPAERLAFMLRDSQAAVLIRTNSETRRHGDRETQAAQAITPSPCHLVTLSDSWPTIALYAADAPSSALDPANAAYAIYTSGSTGRPKGVFVSHQALVNYTLAVAPQFGLRAGDRMLQFASLSFDVLIEELFPAWARGATVVLPGAGLLAPAGEFGRLLDQAQVSVVELPAAYWHAWVDELARSGEAPPPALRLVLLGCEKPLPDRLARWRQFGVPLVYVFGLTETAITSTLYHVPHDVTGEMELPIGRPVANTQIYVLDAHMQPAPIGVPGELYIGGDGLARCYLGRPDLTAERFVPNPFWGMGDKRSAGGGLGWGMEVASPIPHPPSPIPRLYRTGDIARYRADGNLEFLGRRDEQVKLRGFRVELGEIEAALAQHLDVREAVVVAREDVPGDVRLVAYLVTSDKSQVTSEGGDGLVTRYSSLVTEIRGFLQERLPDYMIPSAFVALDALPLTPSGKVDRRALPAPDGGWAAPDERYLAPRTPIEEVLAQLWTDVLRLERVGAHDDFFALGGHSLLATQVIARVREAFQVELPLRSLFERPRLADLAEEVARVRRAGSGLAAPPLLPVARDRALPLSFAQQRLWVIDQLQPQSPAYNVPAAMRLTGPLVVSALRQSLGAITRRHEVLRTTFALVGEQPAQLITPPRAVPLPLLDLQALPAQEREAAATRLATAEAQRPFDLSRGPLLRASVLRLDNAQHVALLTMHHIVADAWSIEILVRELAALYGAAVTGRPAALPPLPVQYADYAVWQRAWLQGSGVRGQGSGAPEEQRTKNKEQNREHLDQESGVRSQESEVDEVKTQNSKLKTQNSPLQAQLAYWRAQLADLPVLELPTDHPRPAIETFRGASEGFALPTELRSGLAALSRASGATPFMTLLAAFQALLSRYSGQDDIVVGTPIANRAQSETAGLIGFFLNTLVLRTDLSGGPSFEALLRRVREVCLDAYAHQDVPFEQVVDDLQPARDLSRHPLFQVLFTLEHASSGGLELPELALRPLSVPSATTKFDLSLSLTESADRLVGGLEYRTDLFETATITRMLGHFQMLLEQIVAHPSRPLADLALLTEAERHQLLVDWNATAVAYPQGECLHQLVEAQAARTPDVVAAVFDRGQGSGVRGQPDKESGVRSQESGVRSSGAQSPITNPQSPIRSPQSSVLSPQSLTYRELNERANRLAQHLRALGVRPEVPVAVCMERSLALLVALLGVLKAGGAYVPLDPAYPAERLAFMLQDSQAAVLITTTDHRPPTTDDRRPTNDQRLAIGERETPNPQSPIPNPHHPLTLSPCHLVTLSESWTAIARCAADNPVSVLDPANLAYVIYTSGSTGTPKGVAIAHQSAVALMSWARELFAPEDLAGVLATTSICFDLSVFELFVPLSWGGRVVLAENIARPPIFLDAMEIRLINTVPSALAEVLHLDGVPASVRTVNLAGEPLPRRLAQQLYARDTIRRVFNLYGPTESTTYSTAALVDPRDGATPSIGRPINNTQVYLLDRQLHPVPIGVPGALYIGGAGLARGYLGRPDLTADCFMPNPFADQEQRTKNKEQRADGAPATQNSKLKTQNLRLYRTGDVARYRPDGNLEYLGRADTQVKVRGFRIELGEVEAALAQHPAVREAVVLVREDVRDSKQLVAYVVPTTDHRPPTNDQRAGTSDSSSVLSPQSSVLRTFLKERLPEYMLPAAFVMLDALPLTPNGKVDRRALPAPDSSRPALDDAFVAPRTPVEATLAQIWAAVLRLEHVGVNDNFFALGGDSILSIQSVARARQAGLHLTPRQMFEYQTIAELAAVVGTASAGLAEQGLVEGHLPLTPIQRWFFDQDLPDPHHFNQSLLFLVRRPLDFTLVARVVQHLLAHHDALRLRFVRDAGGWRQFNAASDPRPAVTLVDLSAVPAAEQPAAIAAAAASLQTSLDLAHGPLIRVATFDLGADRPGRLLLLIHHLAVDGVSWRVLLEDLQSLYGQISRGEAPALPPKTTAFKQWAERLAAYARSDELRQERDYWLAAARRTSARLPVDYANGANTVESAHNVMLTLDAEATHALLHEVPPVYHTQINDVLLAALVQTLAAWTGERALAIDLEGHGREDLFEELDVSRTVGWFTTLFPVLLDARGADGPGATLQAIKEQLRAVPQRGLGYGLLRYLSDDAEVVEALRAQPPAEVMFNYLGQADQAVPSAAPPEQAAPQAGLLAPAGESSGADQSPQGRRSHLLEVGAMIADGRLRMEWTYSEQVHDRATIERLAQGYLDELEALIAHCQSPDAGGYTPSDFPFADLDQQGLSKISSMLEEIDESEDW